MTKFYFLISIILSSTLCNAQPKILIYHETNGFRHGSIAAGIAMFEDLGNENSDWITDNSQSSTVFTNSNLEQYDLVVFLNTSGADENGNDGELLSATEKLALEVFISEGKGFIGIHAATDTYRDGSWPFYNELVGGIIQTSPNHTSNNFNADMEIITSHPIIDFLGNVGDIWNKNEEYYYWELNGGQLSEDNTVLLKVEPTGTDSYDVSRPITWYKESITFDNDNNDSTPAITLSGFRSFYTALGHNSSDYNSNSNFRNMIKNAVLWALEGSTLTSQVFTSGQIRAFPNPVTDVVKLILNKPEDNHDIQIYNALGQLVISRKFQNLNIVSDMIELDLNNLDEGLYFLSIVASGHKEQIKLLKK